MKMGVVKFLGLALVCLWVAAISGCGGGEKKADERKGTVGAPGVSGAAGEQRGTSASGKEEGVAGAPVAASDVQAPPEPEADEPPPETSTRDAQNAEVLIGQPALYDVLTTRQDPQQPPPDWIAMSERHVQEWAAYFSKQLQKQQADESVSTQLEPEHFFMLSNPRTDDPWYVDSILDIERVAPSSGQKVSPMRYFHGLFKCWQGSETRDVGYYMAFSDVKKVDASNYLVQYHPYVHTPCVESSKQNRALAKGLLVLNTTLPGAQLQTAFNGVLIQHLTAPTVRVRMVVGSEKLERREFVMDGQRVEVSVRVPDETGPDSYNLLMLMIEGAQVASPDLGKIFLKRNIEPVMF